MEIFATLNRWLGLSADTESRSNPLNDPTVPLSSPAIWQWLTGGETTAAGELVNEHTALQITTVYACVRLIAQSVASLPFKLYELIGSGRQEAVDSLLYYLLAYEPNPEMSAFTFWETITGCLCLAGNAYAQIERNGSGQPVALWPLHPLKTQPFRQADNSIAYRTSDGMSLGQTRVLKASDVLHIPLFCWDGLQGFSPVQLARQSLGLAKATEKFGARFFGNGSRPGGVLTSKANPDAKTKQELSESWNRAQGGVNQGKTAFLYGDWSYQQIGLSPEDSQFLSTRMYQRADIAALWGVAPHMVGDTSRLSNGNHEQQSLQFITQTLRPYLSRIEAEVKRKLLPTVGRKANCYVVSFDVSELLRGDFAATQAGYATGRQWGWFTANDVLRKQGLNIGGPELDVYMVPVNMQNAKLLLNTEPIQDAPLPGGKPNGTDPNSETDPEPSAAGEGSSGAGDAPTPAERSALGNLTPAHLRLFRDAVGRLIHRDKRDYAAISACLMPAAAALSAEFSREAGDKFGLSDGWNQAEGRFLRQYIKSVEDRAQAWTESDAEKISATELTKATRSLLMATFREAGAIVAMKGMAHAN